jgi:hypothetical protein
MVETVRLFDYHRNSPTICIKPLVVIAGPRDFQKLCAASYGLNTGHIRAKDENPKALKMKYVISMSNLICLGTSIG